jgi:multiple sugar transport system substrate-binding protein
VAHRGKEQVMIEIVFSMSWGFDPHLWRRVLNEEFNPQHQGQIRVKYQNFPSDTYHDDLQRMFEGKGQRIDVIAGDAVWTAEFASKGWIADLSGRFPQAMRQQFLPGTIQTNTYQGKYWGVPWFTDVGLLYYRKDLLDKEGFFAPPQTWNELKQIAKQVKKHTPGIQYGLVFQGAQNDGGVCNGLEYIWSHGGDVLDPQNPAQVIIGRPQTVDGLTTERRMITEGVSPQKVDSFDEVQHAWPEFVEERAVFCRNWAFFYVDVPSPDHHLIRSQVEVAPIPAGAGGQGAGCLGGFNLFINNASDAPHKDAAWQFIRFMTDATTQKRRAINNVLLPTREAPYQEPDLTQQLPITPRARVALDKARLRPVHRHYSEMSTAMAKQFNRCLKGQVTPAQAAQTLQTSLSSIV